KGGNVGHSCSGTGCGREQREIRRGCRCVAQGNPDAPMHPQVIRRENDMDDTDAYAAFQAGNRLLDEGHAEAAAVALERARALEPAKGSVRETLARAYFRSGRFAAAEDEFRAALD